jgi:hypothetical protein
MIARSFLFWKIARRGFSLSYDILYPRKKQNKKLVKINLKDSDEVHNKLKI